MNVKKEPPLNSCTFVTLGQKKLNSNSYPQQELCKVYAFCG